MATPEANPFVFLDRDGTLVEEVNYGHKLEDYALISGAIESLQRLRDAYNSAAPLCMGYGCSGSQLFGRAVLPPLGWQRHVQIPLLRLQGLWQRRLVLQVSGRTVQERLVVYGVESVQIRWEPHRQRE